MIGDTAGYERYICLHPFPDWPLLTAELERRTIDLIKLNINAIMGRDLYRSQPEGITDFGSRRRQRQHVRTEGNIAALSRSDAVVSVLERPWRVLL
jgi:hypothetical protein